MLAADDKLTQKETKSEWFVCFIVWYFLVDCQLVHSCADYLSRSILSPETHRTQGLEGILQVDIFYY